MAIGMAVGSSTIGSPPLNDSEPDVIGTRQAHSRRLLRSSSRALATVPAGSVALVDRGRPFSLTLAFHGAEVPRQCCGQRSLRR